MSAGAYNSSGEQVVVTADLLKKIAGEDLVNDVTKIERQNSFAVITTATTTTVKASAGNIAEIRVIGGTLGAITVYDNTAASGTVIVPAVTPPTLTSSFVLKKDCNFDTGLTIVTAAATLIVISYR